MRFRWRTTLLVVSALLGIGAYLATPYARAASLFVRAAEVGGRLGGLADATARSVTVLPTHVVPTRQGDITAQWYRPTGRFRRAALLVPGIHSMGITEPRLTALAADLAGSGVAVMALALPDLTAYRITSRSADAIEDAVAWIAAQPEFAPDGRVGIVGISFAGGLSIVAAGRPAVRDKIAYVLSLGGHGDLPRVLTYLTTGKAVQAPGVVTQPPHDYGVAVVTHAAADMLVPPEQATPLREGIRTFLLASQLTLVNVDQANRMFQEARDIVKTLPEPSATVLTYVNDRNVKALGLLLAPHFGPDADPAASPERAPSPPAAPVFLLHGSNDAIIPAAESVVLAASLRRQGVEVRLLISEIITHAELDRSAAASESWKLIAFWAHVLRL